MFRKFSKVFAFLLVCALFTSVMTPVKATGAMDEKTTAQSTYESRYKLFNFRASNVQDILRTNRTNKMFATYEQTGRRIVMEGTLTYAGSSTASYPIRLGLCHHVSPYGHFSNVATRLYRSGSIKYNVYVSDLPTDNNYADAQTYYAFVENVPKNGGITGDITVYSAA